MHLFTNKVEHSIFIPIFNSKAGQNEGKRTFAAAFSQCERARVCVCVNEFSTVQEGMFLYFRIIENSFTAFLFANGREENKGTIFFFVV